MAIPHDGAPVHNLLARRAARHVKSFSLRFILACVPRLRSTGRPSGMHVKAKTEGSSELTRKAALSRMPSNTQLSWVEHTSHCLAQPVSTTPDQWARWDRAKPKPDNSFESHAVAPFVARSSEQRHLSVDSFCAHKSLDFVPAGRASEDGAESNEVEDGHAKIDKRKWRWCREKAPPCTISLGFDR